MKHVIVVVLFSLPMLACSGQANFYTRLADSALVLTRWPVVYDAGYCTIKYPNGDVPPNKGVCTDVVIRAYRKVGIDLQKEVHEDMQSHFAQYPKNWGLRSTDKNIDHRRVPNLMKYFERHQAMQPITNAPADYQPGDIVSWRLSSGVPHIGIVANRKSGDKKRYLVVHNIGAGQVVEDCLFGYTIIGHYRFKKKIAL